MRNLLGFDGGNNISRLQHQVQVSGVQHFHLRKKPHFQKEFVLATIFTLNFFQVKFDVHNKGVEYNLIPVLWIQIRMDPHLFFYLAVNVMDPDPYWECGSGPGSRSIEIYQN